MKIYKLIIFCIVLVAAIVYNILSLKISWFYFAGLFLAVWLAYSFFANFVVKFYRKKRGLPQEAYAYAFPDTMARLMKKVDMRTQLESGLLSMFFILIGMIAFDIYIVFFMKISWWFKGLTIFNSFWACVFLFTSLVGQYQSYVTYMQTVESLQSEQMTQSTLNVKELKGGL